MRRIRWRMGILNRRSKSVSVRLGWGWNCLQLWLNFVTILNNRLHNKHTIEASASSGGTIASQLRDRAA